MTDIWSDKQSRRLFPIIALGGSFGAILGPFLTRSMVNLIGVAPLLSVSAILMFISMLCVLILGYWAKKFGVHRHEVGSDAAIGGGMLDGLKQIIANRFIGYLSVMMILSDAVGTISYVLVTDYSGANFPTDAIARTRFAADVDLSANIIQIAVQLTLTRWLLIRYGAGSVIVTCAFVVMCAYLAMAFSNDPFVPLIGQMPVVALVLIVMRSLAHGMVQPARETLYTLVPRDLRYKGKNAVDTVVWRAGDMASLLSINGLRALGINVAGFGVIAAGLVAASGAIGWYLANRAERGDFVKKQDHV